MESITVPGLWLAFIGDLARATVAIDASSEVIAAKGCADDASDKFLASADEHLTAAAHGAVRFAMCGQDHAAKRLRKVALGLRNACRRFKHVRRPEHAKALLSDVARHFHELEEVRRDLNRILALDPELPNPHALFQEAV